MGLIRLGPGRSRVSLFAQGREVLGFQASQMCYWGPLFAGQGIGKPILDRGRITGFTTVCPHPTRLDLRGFGAGLDSGRAGRAFREADEIWLDLGRVGPFRFVGVETDQVETKAEPGGACFLVKGSARGAERR